MSVLSRGWLLTNKIGRNPSTRAGRVEKKLLGCPFRSAIFEERTIVEAFVKQLDDEPEEVRRLPL